MAAQVKVRGATELRRALRRAGGDLDQLRDAHARAAAYVAGASRARAPRRTGRLAGRVKGNRAQARAVVSVPGVIYAGPIHWGWPGHGIRANPFIAATAQDTESTWIQVYEKDMGRIIDKLGRNYA